MLYDDETKRQIMQTTRDNLERLKDLRISEPVFTKDWYVPEPEPTPVLRRLDTNPNADLEQQMEFLSRTLADVLPAIDAFMQNVNKSCSELKQRAATAEKQLEELNKRLSEMQRIHALDLRSVELAWQSDLMSIREARHKELSNG